MMHSDAIRKYCFQNLEHLGTLWN